jgi:hypothetical protein
MRVNCKTTQVEVVDEASGQVTSFRSLIPIEVWILENKIGYEDALRLFQMDLSSARPLSSREPFAPVRPPLMSLLDMPEMAREFLFKLKKRESFRKQKSEADASCL